MNDDPDAQKDALLDELDELIYQCKNRFSNCYELATEKEPIVNQLCRCLELILSFGIRKTTRSSKKFLTSFGGNRSQESLPITLWSFIREYLNEHEVHRFLILRCVQTDTGRARSWIRNALNEHSLPRYLDEIIRDKTQKHPVFCHDWALLNDTERSKHLLRQIGHLRTILFALDIDNAVLDVVEDSAAGHAENSPTIDEGPTQARLVASSSKRENYVTINEASTSNDNPMNIFEEARLEEVSDDASSLARSAPANSSLLEELQRNRFSSSTPEPSESSNHVALQASSPSVSNQLLTITGNRSSSASLNLTSRDPVVLYPIQDENVTRNSGLFANNASSSSLDSSCERPKDIEINKRLIKLECERDKLDRENTLLKIQLKKYIAAIELLKFNKIVAEESARKNQVDDDSQSSISHNYIKDYEEKLVKVSQMHGELVEFNDYLYKVIQQKDSIISRLRDELVELRGPLPETENGADILSTCSEVSGTDGPIIPPLIHIWIPTAFLSGGFNGKSHHIYQIYIRIRDEEWNVYRRYSQFHTFHKKLKSTHRPVGQFEFPPKKAIGNKDSKVVQDRRKKLEAYLRNVINFFQTLQMNDPITNKEKLVHVIPFLSDKIFLQDRSHSENNLTSTSQNPGAVSTAPSSRSSSRSRPSQGRGGGAAGRESPSNTPVIPYMGF